MKKISMFLCMTFLITSDLYCPRKSTRNKNATSSFYSWLKGAGVLGALGGIGYGVGKSRSDAFSKQLADQEELDRKFGEIKIAENLYQNLTKDKTRRLREQANLVAELEEKKRIESLKPSDPEYVSREIAKAEAQRKLAEANKNNIAPTGWVRSTFNSFGKYAFGNKKSLTEKEIVEKLTKEGKSTEDIVETLSKEAEKLTQKAKKLAQEAETLTKKADPTDKTIAEQLTQEAETLTKKAEKFTEEAENTKLKAEVIKEYAKLEKENPHLKKVFEIEPIISEKTPEAPQGYLEWGWNKISDTTKNIKDGLYTIGSQSMDFVANHKLAFAGATVLGIALWKMGVFNKIANMFYTKQTERNFKESGGKCSIQFKFNNGSKDTVIVTTNNGRYSSSSVLNEQLKNHPAKTEALQTAIEKNKAQKDLAKVIATILNHFYDNQDSVQAQITISLNHGKEQEELSSEPFTFSKEPNNWLSSARECYLVLLKDIISVHKLSDINAINKEERDWLSEKGYQPTFCITVRKHNQSWTSMFKTSSGFEEIEAKSIYECQNQFVTKMSALLQNETKDTTWDIEPCVRYEIDADTYIEYEFKPQKHTFQAVVLGDDIQQQCFDYFNTHLNHVFGGAKIEEYMQPEMFNYPTTNTKILNLPYQFDEGFSEVND